MTTYLERLIQKELEKLDYDLFLDKERHPVYGYVYYSVKQFVPNAKPLSVVEWRMGNEPLPLSMDIVQQVRAQEGDIREAIKAATVNNAARKELMRQERLKEQDEIIEEWQKSKPGKLGVVIDKPLDKS